MTAASYKCDDGQSHPPKCFPARTLLCRRREGAGHWLVARRKAVEHKQRNLVSRSKNTDKGTEVKEADPRGITLDKSFLMQLHFVDKPSELCSVDISEQQLNSVKAEDLNEFDNVAYIKASVNLLSLESFSSFTSLRELDLSLNWLSNMTFDASDFPHLQVLDLSYNSLSAEAIISIGGLSCLKVLHLSGNQLHHLPPHLGSSNREPDQLPVKEEDAQFRALEVLMLDDNKLSSDVFVSLSNLKRLQCLNLQGNCITEIPFMHQRESSKHLHTSVQQQSDEETFGKCSLGSPRPLSHTFDLEDKEDVEEHYQTSRFPLPELHFLNLANNKIAEEEALLAAVLFPLLSEIDICSNPLTTRRSGDPPLLTYYLQERLGVTIKRKKTPDVSKLPLTASIHPRWKAEERVPKVPPPKTTGLRAQRDEDKNYEEEEKEEEEEEEEIFPNPDAFFVTQTTDVPDYEVDLRPNETETAGSDDRLEDDTTAEKCKYYKMSTDAKADPDVAERVGIQTAVRILEHTLKNLTVYRDSKPKPDHFHAPRRERERRVQEFPPQTSRKRPKQRVEEALKQIKASSTLREISLSVALKDADVKKQEYKEAVTLLKDMKLKYRSVHGRTMERVAGSERDVFR
ncbi:X-ray radiation resistance-associated protein 1 [Genypterus blacodes]|uniref:X-ray radiation resistance-associated protein 1 n=1 Tax=Genypterus blacodes TaxID=154954 RepID=UPI003F778102